MNSELQQRGPRIFHRYHQSQRYRDAHRGRGGGDCVVDATTIGTTPARKGTARPRSRSNPASFNGDHEHPPDNDLHPRHVLYHHRQHHNRNHNHRFATGRNPMDEESSPNSTKSIRIVSLDRCCEETVSPLFADSSSAASSQSMIQEFPVPRIQLSPSRAAYPVRDGKALADTETISSVEVSEEDHWLERRRERIKIAPPGSNTRRRRSSHNRSRFVFDGNLSLGSISPTNPTTFSSLLPSPNRVASSSPQRGSYPSPGMMNYPPLTPSPLSATTPMTSSLSMTPMTPPQALDSSRGSIGQEHRRNQGRRTPPPTPTEQRSRNKAMPSIQYQTLVFDKMLEQEQQQQQQQQQKHQEHARLCRQQTW